MFQKALENCPYGDILIFKEMKAAVDGVVEDEVKVHAASATKKCPTKPVQRHEATPQEVARLGIGAFQVNTQSYEEAVRIYSELLLDNPGLVEARAGLGSAYAMLSRFDDAILTFAALVELDPANVDGWIRLAQTRCASGHVMQAKLDLDKAISLDDRNALAHLERGMVLKRIGDEPAALVDLQTAVRLDPQNHLAWQSLGACLHKLGLCTQAHAAFEKSLGLKTTKECLCNMAQSQREFGNHELAMKYFKMALDIDPHYVNALDLRGGACYTYGSMQAAIRDFSLVVELDASNTNALQMKGTALQSLGRFQEAIKCYDAVLTRDPKHICWFLKEIALFSWSRVDDALSSFHLDMLHSGFKDIFIKRGDPAAIFPPYDRQPGASLPQVEMKSPLTSEQANLVDLVQPFEARIVYHSPGFVANRRQMRMFALATVHVAQTCRTALQKSVGGKQQSWRDVMDVAVKWRQFSEPNDPVYWVDLLDQRAFQEGFGLQTPLVSGHTRIARYYPYFDRCFALMKTLMADTLAPAEQVSPLGSLEELYKLIGHDFYVTTPTHSCCGQPSMEGTRLTIQSVGPLQGHVFSIRTPGTPERFKQFDRELSFVWTKLCGLLETPEVSAESIYEQCLAFYFYWVNFGCLSRGTAACGVIALHALLLSFNLSLPASFPEGVQLDWEAITVPRCEDFVKVAKGFFPPSLLRPCELAAFPDVNAAVPNLRALIRCCNMGIE